MKKRILALALCLVLATSLLPVTALALTDDDIIGIKDQGIYCGDTYFTVTSPVLEVKNQLTGEIINPDNGRYKLSETCMIVFLYNDGSGNVNTKGLSVRILNHDWQFTQTENSLKAICQNRVQYPCSIGEASLMLDAHSVTLPDSPFNAQLEGREQFKAAFPNAVIGDLVYKYHGPNGWSVVEPTAANAKAGEYQVGVRITIPSNNAGDNVGGQNQDQVYDLYVKYTAADPAITAQTGDNRPIEMMMGSVVVFSAIAAAAFILDSKRKYSR